MTALRPLTLSAAQVRALQSGPVEVRRKMTPQPRPGSSADCGVLESSGVLWFFDGDHSKDHEMRKSPFGPIGARFWVREAWGKGSFYAADHKSTGEDWRPAQTMPREYSRYDVTLTALRVEQIGGVWYWVGTVEQVEK
jgi:hypothetical protein